MAKRSDWLYRCFYYWNTEVEWHDSSFESMPWEIAGFLGVYVIYLPTTESRPVRAVYVGSGDILVRIKDHHNPDK